MDPDPRSIKHIRRLALIFLAGVWLSASAEPFPLQKSGQWKTGELRRGEDGRLYLETRIQPEILVVCKDKRKTKGCQFTRIADAVRAVRQGGVIEIHPGIYEEAAVIAANHVRLLAQPGAEMRGVAAQGKGALVIKGDSVTIEGLACSGIKVSSRNGACIRLEGRNLTLRNVYFHDSEQGILGGRGAILIEDSRFERLGAEGRAHAIYVSGQELIIRRSRILASKDEGHEVKTRTAKTLIEDCVIASLDGDDSRLIDVSNGGAVIIRRNILEEGPASANHEMIGIGYEGLEYPENSVLIEGNTVIVDRSSKKLFGGPAAMTIRDNHIVGGYPIDGNRYYPDRRAAGLREYPALPDRPLDPVR